MCIIHRRKKKCTQSFGRNPDEKTPAGKKIGIDGRITLKCILRK
jgi:hypothetical protein